MKKIKYRFLKFLIKFVSNPIKGKCYNCNKNTDLETLNFCENCYVNNKTHVSIS